MAVQHKSEGSLGPEQGEGRGRWSWAAGKAESRPRSLREALNLASEQQTVSSLVPSLLLTIIDRVCDKRVKQRRANR